MLNYHSFKKGLTYLFYQVTNNKSAGTHHAQSDNAILVINVVPGPSMNQSTL